MIAHAFCGVDCKGNDCFIVWCLVKESLRHIGIAVVKVLVVKENGKQGKGKYEGKKGGNHLRA